ncbi:MAG: hypothetical protein AB1349_10325 [Elusimicrobiota bacterium]
MRELSNNEIHRQAEVAISFCKRRRVSFDHWARVKSFSSDDYNAIEKLFHNKNVRKKVERREIWFKEMFRRMGVDITTGEIIFTKEWGMRKN